MKDWLRKGLDAYEGRQERRDEEFAALVTRNIDALSDRRTLWIYLAVLATANALVWLCVILFPKDVMQAWLKVRDLDDRIAFVIIAIMFGLGMWLTYSLFRLKFPDLENPKFDDEVLASFSYSIHSTKRWRVWLIAVIGGVLNAFLLVFAEIYFNYGL